MTTPQNALNSDTFNSALEELSNRDRDLGRILRAFGPPPFWRRDPGFSTLVHIILEQQVSLASAKAAFDKLQKEIDLTPENFLTLDDTALRTIGFSRQKTRYCRLLSKAILTGSLELNSLDIASDDKARRALTNIKGIGPWTADVYLLMVLRRPDIWPAGDLALQVAVQNIRGLPSKPTAEETIPISEAWRPYRAVAARMLWHYYLST